MPTNDFVPFATGAGANVLTQAAYLANSQTTAGQQPGIAVSALNNKAIRQSSFITSQLAQLISNQLSNDVLDNTVSAQLLAQMTAVFAPQYPDVRTLLSGSGTYELPYIFFTTSCSATVGATYTNNTVTFTVMATVSGALQIRLHGSGAPLVSGTLTKASGTGDATITFYAYRAPLILDIQMVGGGGGGGGTSGNGGNGGNSTFGTTLLVANGGSGGPGNNSANYGGSGGTASLGTGPLGLAFTGAQGFSPSGGGSASGGGGVSPFGGAGAGNQSSASGNAAVSNTGSGGGGASGAGTAQGGGGGAGGYVTAKIVSSISSSYAYAVGGSGAGGSGSGGAGGSGSIIVTANFQ